MRLPISLDITDSLQVSSWNVFLDNLLRSHVVSRPKLFLDACELLVTQVFVNFRRVVFIVHPAGRFDFLHLRGL